jgi:hypothetical protein
MSDNTSATHKKRKAPRSAWKPGQSGNPLGAPKRGQSWAEIITEIGNMTGPEVAKLAGKMGKEFVTLEPGVTLKTLVVIRVYGQMINEPSPGLLNSFMDRVEGKPNQPVSVDWREDAKQNGIDPERVMAIVDAAIERGFSGGSGDADKDETGSEKLDAAP